jgi:hypothetical protein
MEDSSPSELFVLRSEFVTLAVRYLTQHEVSVVYSSLRKGKVQ